MSSMAALVQLNTPSRLTAMTWRQASAVSLWKGAVGAAPALLTRISTGPKAALARSKASATDCSRVTSQLMARAFPRAPASSSKGAAERPSSDSLAPWAAAARAMAAPMPVPPPVTSTWRWFTR